MGGTEEGEFTGQTVHLLPKDGVSKLFKFKR